VLGKISRSRRLRVVFPLEEQPLIPITTAFGGVAIAVESWLFIDERRSFAELEMGGHSSPDEIPNARL
jgi:hypothetical protein